jgi:hypothetical protein
LDVGLWTLDFLLGVTLDFLLGVTLDFLLGVTLDFLLGVKPGSEDIDRIPSVSDPSWLIQLATAEIFHGQSGQWTDALDLAPRPRRHLSRSMTPEAQIRLGDENG